LADLGVIDDERGTIAPDRDPAGNLIRIQELR
jgi:hypothetical protein